MANPNPNDEVLLVSPGASDRLPDHLLLDGKIPTWTKATSQFCKFVRWLSKEDINPYIAVNYATYTEDWAGAMWNELYNFDKTACEWAKQTALISFSGSYYLDSESQAKIPPLTYLEHLQDSRDARQKALSRILSDITKWSSVRVYGADRSSGYPSRFLGLYLSEPVDKEIFRSVIRAHVKNCPLAEPDGHELSSTVTLESNPVHESQLVHGLGKLIPGLKYRGILNEHLDRRRLATALYANSNRPYAFGRSI